MIGFNTKKRAQYKECFSTPAGEVVLKDLMRLCKFNQPTFVVGDTHTTTYYEGMRRVVIYITNLLNQSSEELLKLHNLHGE